MNHNLKNRRIEGNAWSQCKNCGCTFYNKYWWVNGKKSKVEPECSADNLDWERNAIKEDLQWS